MFKWIGEKYGGFDRTREGENIGGGWTKGSIREFRRCGKGKENKLEIDLIDLWDTLSRVKAYSWWEWEDGLAPLFWKWPVGYLVQA